MAAPLRFRTIRSKLGPPWLTVHGESGLVGYALDIVKDAFIERLRQGLLAQQPQQDPTGETTAPPDALAEMGRDRRVVRGIGESDQSYARRLVLWLDDRKTAGSAFALLQKLSEYTGPGPKFRTVDARGNWYTREVDGSESYILKRNNWDWDGRPRTADGRLRWSRFWVIIYPNGLWTEAPCWGDDDAPAWGDPPESTWGSTAPAGHVDMLRAIVADWMPAGTRCVNIILAFDPNSFDPMAAVDADGMPAGLWEHWSRNVDGVQVPTPRLSTARYLDGVQR
ncbi:MAG: hypothetical protein FWD73_06880 [Polyangiaceae bacterium]|nr:hypothetical protein [Polyangiaceae bacterium]